MGFFDRAKSRITDLFGDEVVRKGNFSSLGDEDMEGEKEVSSYEQNPQPERRITDEDSEDGYSEDESETDHGSRVALRDTKPDVINREELANLSKDQGQTVDEILSTMKIQGTFIIDDGILFLDDELEGQSFSTQAPYGYDTGEVDFFLAKTRRSIAEYVRLLKLRNDDVIKLASRISDLMVEVNNLRFNSEMANGINIMASNGDDDSLAVELDEARLKIKKLEQELGRVNSSGTSARIDTNQISALRDELFTETIRRTKLESEIQDLRAHLALIEEEYDIEVFANRGDLQAPKTAESGYVAYEKKRESKFHPVEGLDDRPERELYAEEKNFQSVGRDHWLPRGGDEELPRVEGGLENVDFEEESLADIDIDPYVEKTGDFNQTMSTIESEFAVNPYQTIDEFVEQNKDSFPEDSISDPHSLEDYEDPDEDGFQYSFERSI